ncbi:leucine--tRNA ligase [Candidatus Micrarchaeota archaeon]|nr:leucine--tRNA ligase [Candidatus Micrarchaeota archaeon]
MNSANDIDQKWQKIFEEEKLFESDPDKREKKFISPAFPYPNSPQHIGHARTYTTTDIYARYLRLQGYNVLFPMAFHVTGTPILAMARRLQEKDAELLQIFENIYGIPRKTAESLTDPRALVLYFSKEIEAGMKEMGYSIDWRRKFYSFDPKFNKFIQWQFKKLKDLGLIVKGEHPVPWCPKDNNAVGGHDTKGDVDPELKEFMWIKFHLKDSDLILMTGTTRPDALLGQTNLWVDPNANYVIIKVKGEKWVVGKAAVEKIKKQYDQTALIIGEISAKELIGKWVKGPIVNYELYLLPAAFINENVGSGLVYSALEDPVDLYELRKLQNDQQLLSKYSLQKSVVQKLKPIPIINVEGMSEDLGDSIGKEFGITSAEQKDKLEEAKGELNRRVYRKGIMREACGKYSGMTVPVCQEQIKKELTNSDSGVMFWEINNNPVHCRCGAEVIVNLVKDQWFINYGDEEWKKKARSCLESMSIIPEKTRVDYLYTINWLKEKACARAAGLGTRFPFDETKMIEALSDSTIYMAFYTIAHLLHDFKPEELDEEFFDHLFLAKRKEEDVKLKKLKDSFEYWYPLDSRHSGADLVRNHLPFFILNHVAIFPKHHWPKQIVTNGFVLMDGKKMSKSMGNILPLRKAIQEYGADIIRFSVVSGADLTQDTDFNKTVAEGVKSRLAFISRLIGESKSKRSTKTKSRIEKWLHSRLNRKIKLASELYSKVAIRELSLELFYGVYDDLQWYMKRSKEINIHDYLKTWSVLVSPFIPHHAEEFYSSLGGKGFAMNQKFPEAGQVDESVENGEELVKQSISDIENVKKILGKEPKEVYIYVASEWKRKLYDLIRKEKSFDKIMKGAVSDSILKSKMADVQRITKQLMKNVHSLPEVMGEKDELETLTEAGPFFETELKCNVHILTEDKSKHERSKNALPGKPAIVLE